MYNKLQNNVHGVLWGAAQCSYPTESIVNVHVLNFCDPATYKK